MCGIRFCTCRGVAQLGRALRSGAWGCVGALRGWGVLNGFGCTGLWRFLVVKIGGKISVDHMFDHIRE